MNQHSAHHIRFRGRSFPVLTLELDAPLDGWIGRLDACLERSPAFFARKSVVIDVSGLSLDRSEVVGLVESLSTRGVRIMGLTGVESSWESSDLPPILTGGRAFSLSDATVDSAAADTTDDAHPGELPESDRSQVQDESPPPTSAAPLVVEATVRSGQSIFHPDGDVIVIGSVASGADVRAGGSVHIYGTLRGRVMAGVCGEARARIFCRRLDAELLAVGGVYLTADEIAPTMRGAPIQAWLEGEAVKIAKLD